MANSQSVLPRTMKTFLIVWNGQLISMLGSGLSNFVLGVWIYDQSKQATSFAITVLLGSLADRINRRLIMILADSANALLTLAISCY